MKWEAEAKESVKLSIDDRLRQIENEDSNEEIFDAPSPHPDDDYDFPFDGGPQPPPPREEEEPQVHHL